jgi:hypothetical protein
MQSTLTMNVNSTSPLSASVSPAGANQGVTYSVVSSSPSGVVTVNSSTGVVTAGSVAGTATIRATSTADSTKFAECAVTVQNSTGSGGFDVFDLTVEINKHYRVTVQAENMDTFAGKTIAVSYDPTALQLTDFAAQTPQKDTATGAIAGTDVTVISHSNGKIAMQFGKTIPSGQSWSGVITILEFKALKTGSTQIEIQLQ